MSKNLKFWKLERIQQFVPLGDSVNFSTWDPPNLRGHGPTSADKESVCIHTYGHTYTYTCTHVHAHIETCTHTGRGQGYNRANVASADFGGLDDVDMKLPYSAVAAFLCSLWEFTRTTGQ